MNTRKNTLYNVAYRVFSMWIYCLRIVSFLSEPKSVYDPVLILFYIELIFIRFFAGVVGVASG